MRIGGPRCSAPYEAALLNVSAMSYGSLSANAVLAMGQACMIDGVLRGNPSSCEEAAAMLRAASGRVVTVVTAVVVKKENGTLAEATTSASLYFSEISEDVVKACAAKRTALEAVGGLAVQEPTLRRLVTRLDGHIDCVLGCPKDLVLSLVSTS